LVGSTFQQTTRSAESFRASGYTNDALLESIASAANLTILTSGFTDYRYNAVFGRANYNLGGKYFFNVTARRDGSSRFGPTKRFANFGALGAAWVFSEQFFKGSRILSFGKFRASFGVTGNDQIADYGYLDSYSASLYPYQGRSGLVPSRLANPDYSWERTVKTEAAIDLDFLDNRLGMSAAYYWNESSNQLTGFNLPRITGFSSVQYNLPATVRNTGLELIVRSTNIKRKDFDWNTSATITIPRNKLVSYPEIETSPNANQWEVGKPLTTTKKFHLIGVNAQTGVYEFEDLNGNGRGTDSPADLVATGFIGQKYYAAVTNSVQFQGLELSFMVQVVQQTGRKYLSSTTMFAAPGVMTNQPVQVLERWQRVGDDTGTQKFTTGSAGVDAYLASSLSDNIVTNSSFVRLRNISVSYQLPQTLIDPWKIQSARIFFQAQNLITFTDYIGMDPEPAIPNSLPPLKVLTGGLQITL
jgi:TonB-dependent starch-binding outer membrane protein SusC